MANNDDRGPVDDRRYGELVDVAHFTAKGHGPLIIRLGVRANVHPSPHYPSARIMIGQLDMPKGADLGGVVLTVQQGEELIAAVRAAIDDAVKACPSLVVRPVGATRG